MHKMMYYSAMICLSIGCSSEQTASPSGDAATTSPSKENNAIAPKLSDLELLYKQQANELHSAIADRKNATAVLKLADNLTQTGLSILPSIITANPECTAYLEAIRAVGSTLKDLPIPEIEAGYHADGELPKTPSAKCYHGKDLVVHPATVAALAKLGLNTEEEQQQAKDEIAEVIVHLEAINTVPE